MNSSTWSASGSDAVKRQLSKLARCLKLCLYRADSRYHAKHGDPPKGKGQQHIDDLVDGCLPACARAALEDQRRVGLKKLRRPARRRAQEFID